MSSTFDKLMRALVFALCLAALTLGVMIGLSLRADAAQHRNTFGQSIKVQLTFCEANPKIYWWITTNNPDVAIAFVRLTFGLIDPDEFKAIVVAVNPDLQRMADSTVQDCFTPLGQAL